MLVVTELVVSGKLCTFLAWHNPIFLPLPNEVAKVMFLVVSVCHSVHRGSHVTNTHDKLDLTVQKPAGFPLKLENGKAFSSRGILNRLEKSGKITQNTGKLWEFEINIIRYF